MKIQDLLNQAKPCWKYAAMDWDLRWYFFSFKPKQGTSGMWILGSETDMMDVTEKRCISHLFDIESFDGDWKDSLIIRNAEK